MDLSLSELEGNKYIKKVRKCKIEAAKSVKFCTDMIPILTDFLNDKSAKTSCRK